ncbi:MAG: 6,7-dimethyl-8-ribityllumazine synthase [Gammaproteobacteria bacterium]
MSRSTLSPAPIHRAVCGTLRIGIVASRFHAEIVDRLVSGCLDALDQAGQDASCRTLIRVPGAWELPWMVQALAGSGTYDAIVALGAVIRGETDHYAHIARECIRGLMDVNLRGATPIALGVLTTDTVESARERVGGRAGHKGVEAAAAAIEMATLRRRLHEEGDVS